MPDILLHYSPLTRLDGQPTPPALQHHHQHSQPAQPTPADPRAWSDLCHLPCPISSCLVLPCPHLLHHNTSCHLPTLLTPHLLSPPPASPSRVAPQIDRRSPANIHLHTWPALLTPVWHCTECRTNQVPAALLTHQCHLLLQSLPPSPPSLPSILLPQQRQTLPKALTSLLPPPTRNLRPWRRRPTPHSPRRRGLRAPVPFRGEESRTG